MLPTLSLNVQTFLHLLFSLNCLILPQVTTWQPLLYWQNHQNRFLNWLPNYHHNLPTLWVVFNVLFLAFVWWCYLDILLTSCKIWIMIRFLFKKSNSYWLHLMGMSCLNYHWFFQLLICLYKCKAWIESTMGMFGTRWSQPISRKNLGLVLGRLIAWATCVVCKMTVRTLYYVLLVMKSFGVVSAHIF